MLTLTEIEGAIAKLPSPEFRELMHKLKECDAAEWDLQIADDARNGILDRLCSRLMGGESRHPKVAFDEVLDDPEFS